MAKYIDVSKVAIPKDFFNDLNVPKLLDWLNSQPAADVVEVKHGKWIPTYHHGKFTGGKCSVCGKFKKTYNIVKLHKSYRFCHKCGAKMDGKE